MRGPAPIIIIYERYPIEKKVLYLYKNLKHIKMKKRILDGLDAGIFIGMIVFVFSCIIMYFGNPIGDYLLPRTAIVVVLMSIIREGLTPKSKRT